MPEERPIIVTMRTFSIKEGENAVIKLDLEHLVYFKDMGNGMKHIEGAATTP